MIDERPNPDQLLARVQAEEKQQERGKLKIFLGYAAGVGKTYAMLDAAQHQRKSSGVDIVIAYVETHGRKETDALVQGLEVMPRRQVEYRGAILTEMDVDAVLARRPKLALVDELAHSNAPSSRHPKRYQDVEEMLEAGIDVYATLNIQHLESLNDIVAQITGIVVHETIPDSVIDEANEIELVDLPPDELLQRLKEGKVYVADQAARAIERFFRKGNLTALRELSLRRTALRVDDQMRAYMETRAIVGPWAANDRLLVCISPGALSERLVRTGRRLADELRAEWYALYIETPDHQRLSTSQRERITHALGLAEELGAKVTTMPSPSVADTVIHYARTHNITKIIAGKPVRPILQQFLHRSTVDQIISHSGSIDVYVISGGAERTPIIETDPWLPHRPLRRYLFSLLMVVLVTLIGIPVRELFSPINLVMLYLLAIVASAVYLGRGPSVVTTVTSVLAFDFFYVPPYLTFAVADAQYLLTFGVLLIVGLVISDLAVRLREQVVLVQRRESETAELYEFSRDLSAAAGWHEILESSIKHVGQTFNRQAALLLPEGEELKVRASSLNFFLDDNARAVATWAFQHKEPAGRGTDTLPAALIRCLPLRTANAVVGVLAVRPKDQEDELTPEQRRLLESFASQTALAVERAQLGEQARRAQLLQATERLQTALLDSISHDLRTPLVSITGALSALQEDNSQLDAAARRNLIETASDEAVRLNHLVGNLLDMTRIEGGAIRLKREPSDVQDVIGSALDRLADRLQDRQVLINLPPTLPLVPMDFTLIVQVFVSLLDNALKYSFPDTPIEVNVRLLDQKLQVQVADRGIGIPKPDLERVFDKFFRVQRQETSRRVVPIAATQSDKFKRYRVERPEKAAGTGLGLSICKGIMEAHGGTIRAENRDGGGTTITFTLPLATETLP
jgi:two-component system, OmpR family, sensor histidine kinase KdpD